MTKKQLLQDKAGFSITKFNELLLDIAQMPAVRKSEKQNAIQVVTNKIEDKLDVCHTELYLTQL